MGKSEDMTTLVYKDIVDNFTRPCVSGCQRCCFGAAACPFGLSGFYIKSAFLCGWFFDNLRKKEFFSKKVCTNRNFCAKIFP